MDEINESLGNGKKLTQTKHDELYDYVFLPNNNWLVSIADHLSDSAKKLNAGAIASKVLTITLGALVATNGAATEIWGTEYSEAILSVYTIIGVLIAIVGGLDAAFKFEAKLEGRRLLAGEVDTKHREMNLLWETDVIAGEGDLEIAKGILTDQIAYVEEVQKRAAELGVNLLKLEENKRKTEKTTSFEDELPEEDSPNTSNG